MSRNIAIVTGALIMMNLSGYVTQGIASDPSSGAGAAPSSEAEALEKGPGNNALPKRFSWKGKTWEFRLGRGHDTIIYWQLDGRSTNERAPHFTLSTVADSELQKVKNGTINGYKFHMTSPDFSHLDKDQNHLRLVLNGRDVSVDPAYNYPFDVREYVADAQIFISGLQAQ